MTKKYFNILFPFYLPKARLKCHTDHKLSKNLPTPCLWLLLILVELEHASFWNQNNNYYKFPGNKSLHNPFRGGVPTNLFYSEQ